MSLSYRTCLQELFLVAVIAGIASYAAAMPQDTVSLSYAAPSADARSPVVSTNATPYSTGIQEQQSLRNLYDSLLVEGAGGDSLTESVLVVPSKPMDPPAVRQAIEDLSVMSRIIEKNALGDYRMPGSFIGPWTTTGPAILFPVLGRAKPMYLGGYGALFFIQVNYPLLPPPQAPKEQPANPQEDPVWAEARRSVLEPQARPVVPQEAEPTEPYSTEQVDTLRSELIATLKHATNIRVLEPTEWVTIVVQGPASTTPGPEQENLQQFQQIYGEALSAIYASQNQRERGRTLMTLRVNKADIDQHAKGQLDQAQFAQRVQMVTY